jgi:DNA-binding beta-propeller fold protein YncE
MRNRRAALVFAFLLVVPLRASALTLAQAFIIDTVSTIFSGPEGVATGLDPADGEQVIYVSQGDSCATCRVDIYRQDSPNTWVLKRHFFLPSAQGGDTRGLDVNQTNGNLLVSTVGGARVYEAVVPTIDGATATLPVGGVDFQPVGLASGTQLESAVFADGAIYIVDEEGVNEAGRIYRFTTAGVAENLPGLGVSNFLFADVNMDNMGSTLCPVAEGSPLSEGCYNDPSGSAYNPFAQRIYVVDDNSGRTRSRIFEYDLSGNLIGFSDLMTTLTAGIGLCATQNSNTPIQCDDAEGLGFIRIDGVDYLLIGFEESSLVTAFLITPEPGTLALLALGALVFARRRSA